MPSKDLKHIVVNASVATAAGGVNATAAVSINCTVFLETFRDETSNHIVMTLELSEEWEEHRSNFSATWLANIIARKRFHFIQIQYDRTLFDRIEETTDREKNVKALQKDFHLIQAALAADNTIVSLDENIRMLFAKASQQVGEIRNIVWVNPDQAAENLIQWLKDGAPSEQHRQLSAYQVV